ncbi:MAG: ribonuclease H-like domain-containing protein [Planctomycetota bacterium]
MSESRKRKLSMLAKSLSAGDVTSAQKALDEFGHAGVNLKRPPSQPQTLEQACGGAETTIDIHGGKMPYWLIRRPLSEVSPDDVGISREFAAVLAGARQRFDELEASAALCHVADGGPEDVLFMDTETCGFSGSCIFLVGLMACEDRELVFEQHLARNYAEEAAILAAFAERLTRHRVLVTFNGKAFDMNMIKERSAFHGVDLPIVDGPPDNRMPPHLDLLHESRRRWKRTLPNCRLQTLETHLCQRVRHGDIPGSAIPDAYHRFVDTADARQLRDILHHNLLDLLTMAQLLAALLTSTAPEG